MLASAFQSQFSFAQNLVPNFSFEQFDTCPNSENQIRYAIGWANCSNPGGGTPDYYNACAAPDSFGVPYSFFTHQDEYRGCNAYAALVLFSSGYSNYREFIGIQLNQSLLIGQKYFLSFNTVMSEFSYNGTQFGMPSNNIGIHLSTIQYTSANPCPIDNYAHLRSIAIINDSTNWHRISGSIIADSMYDYIMVGNFFDDVNTDTLHYNCTTCQNYGCYYLIDDICLSTDSLTCNGGLNELPCTAYLHEIASAENIKVFPNPVDGLLNISLEENMYNEIEIFDVFGKFIYSKKIEKANATQLNLSMFLAGTYLLKIINNENHLACFKKIIKL